MNWCVSVWKQLQGLNNQRLVLLSQYRSNWKTLFAGNSVRILIKHLDSTSSLVIGRLESSEKACEPEGSNLCATDLREIKFGQGELCILPAILTDYELTGRCSRPPRRRRPSTRWYGTGDRRRKHREDEQHERPARRYARHHKTDHATTAGNFPQ